MLYEFEDHGNHKDVAEQAQSRRHCESTVFWNACIRDHHATLSKWCQSSLRWAWISGPGEHVMCWCFILLRMFSIWPKSSQILNRIVSGLELLRRRRIWSGSIIGAITGVNSGCRKFYNICHPDVVTASSESDRSQEELEWNDCWDLYRAGQIIATNPS